ncbi:MAG: RnfABCDGE type electron transport complex subunit D, partial [Candidatus Izimaplasma sp.]|nr:RnfABCDGE type electron transport complex subunit D [Candidatus Izimaplasma bacterium]
MENTLPKIIRKTSPYLRRPKANVTRMMRDVTIALLPVTGFAIYKYGMTALIIIALSILSMAATEYLYYQLVDKLDGDKFKLKNKSYTLYNFSVITSGLIYALTLPDNTPWFVVIIGAMFGVFFGKLIFGGMGQNVFNPAALGRVFIFVSFGTMMSYDIDAVAGSTALTMLNNDVFNIAVLENFSLINLFTGIGIPGSIGEMSAILIILGGVYLAFRTSFEVRIPLAYVGTVALLATVVALYKGLGVWYPIFHVLGGGLLFGAIFMATDPITSPITKGGRIYFGFALGVLTFFIRVFGAYPEGVVFSILIMNMFVTTFDYHKWTNQQITKKQKIIFLIVVLVTILVTIVGVSYV